MFGKGKSIENICFNLETEPAAIRKRIKTNGNNASKGSVKKLARKGGIKRINSMIHESLNLKMRSFLEEIIKSSIAYMELARRKTLMPRDVVYALKKKGITLYGF